MSDQKPLLSMKKTLFYNFFPSNEEEEEACKLNNTPWVATRELIEIRDLYPASKINLENPWQMKKNTNLDKIVLGMLVISFFEMFEYILRYWTLDMDKILVENGCGVRVDMWDVTEENVPKKYDSASVYIRRLYNDDDYTLSCMELFKDRRLGIGDEIGLYWDPRSSSLMFKLFSQVRA